MPNSCSEITKFFDLAYNAKIADDELRADFSNSEYEAVVDHVLAHSGSRADFADAFMKIVYEPSLGPLELVEYCMHYLRWQEFQVCIRSRLENESSERARFVLRRLLESFADSWPGADVYRRFHEEP